MCALHAQVAVPVGAGSYASFPPTHEGTHVADMLTRTIYVTDPTRPIPSNDWWTDVVVSRYAGTMWAYPLAVAANEQGVNIFYPTTFNSDGTALVTASPLQIRGEVPPSTGPGDLLIADFESAAYPAGWTTTGTAFGTGPAAGTLPGQSAVSGYLGTRLVNSFRPGDSATGTLTSPEFSLSQSNLHFLIAGGNLPGLAEVQLLVTNGIVRKATGANSESLRWNSWDVSPWLGQPARLRILDNATGGWGHINADQFFLSSIATNPASVFDPAFAPADARAREWSDWLVQFRMAQRTNRFLDVTMGHGFPFVWVEFTNVAPRIRTSTAARCFTAAGTFTAFPATLDRMGIEYDGRLYGIYAPDGTQFARSGDTISVAFPAGGGTYLAVGALTTTADLEAFRPYASAIPRETRMDWVLDAERARVRTTWRVTAQALKGTATDVLQGWIPHHYRTTTHDLSFTGQSYLTPRGRLKLAAGNTATIEFPFRGVLPALPAPSPLGLTNDYDAERMKLYVQLYATRTGYGAETYFGGKDLTQLGTYLNFAHELGMDAEAKKLGASLHHALADWFTYTPGETEHYFARYPNWGALVGFNESFYSYQFTDHHFHYGYFTLAAALLGMHDPDFLRYYAPMATLVAREYANWDREDRSLPFLRTFDIWNGHSYAGGFSSPGGNNQESSSEAMQSWTGLFLLGTMLGETNMTATGAMGYAMESLAVEEYWNNYYGWRDGLASGNFSPAYAATNTITGILFDSGQAYATYFSGDPGWIYGIQWLPITPGLNYLVRDPAFAAYQYTNMMTRRAASIAPEPNTFSQMGTALGQVVLGYVQLFNPGHVASEMDALWAAADPVATDNSTPGITYYHAHSQRGLGRVAWEFTSSFPTSQSYFNEGKSRTTHVLYNPKDSYRLANLYSNGIPAGQAIVPPRTLLRTSSLIQPSTHFSVLGTSPADGAVGVSKSLYKIAVAFSKPVNPATLGGVTISGPGVTSLTGISSQDPALNIFTINGDRRDGAEYVITLPTSLTAMDGSVLAEPVVVRFRIAEAAVVDPGTDSALSARYRLDETTGTVALDDSAQHLDGTFLNAPALGLVGAKPATGTSIGFDGVSDYVQLPRTFTLKMLGDFTVAAWIRPDVTTGDRPIVGTDGYTPQQGLHLLVRDGHAHFGFYGDDTPGTRPILAGTWQHVAFRFHADEQAIFVDGALDVASPGHNTFAGVDPVLLGRWGGKGGSPSYFQGRMDDVQIYHRALTDDEIAGLYLNPGSVNTNAYQNFPPTVRAGADVVVDFPTTVQLNGTVTDDGNLYDPSYLYSSWSVVSAPGPLRFSDPESPKSSVSFSTPGTYVLRLRATDGSLNRTDDVAVSLLVGDLLAHYALDETNGTTCLDNSGNGFSGVYTNAPLLRQAGAATGTGASVDFNGSTEFVHLGSPAPLNALTNNFTVALWVRPDATGGNRVMFGCNWQGYNGWSLRLSGGALALERLGPTQLYNSGVTVPTARWTHVAASYSASNSVTFFTNGVPVATIAGTAAATPATRPWFIGSNGGGDNTDGRIDDVQVYRRALAPAEVSFLYTNPGKTRLPAVAPPQLSIERISTGIQLHWPIAAYGFGLVSSAEIGGTTSWTPVTNAPVFTGEEWQLSLPLQGAVTRYFRLQNR